MSETSLIRSSRPSPRHFRSKGIITWLMWIAFLMPFMASAMIPELAAAAFVSSDLSGNEGGDSSSSHGGGQGPSRTASRRAQLQANARKQRYDERNLPPPPLEPEWFSKCKEEFVASEAAKNPAGASIFQLNATPLTVAIMMLL